MLDLQDFPIFNGLNVIHVGRVSPSVLVTVVGQVHEQQDDVKDRKGNILDHRARTSRNGIFRALECLYGIHHPLEAVTDKAKPIEDSLGNVTILHQV